VPCAQIKKKREKNYRNAQQSRTFTIAAVVTVEAQSQKVYHEMGIIT